MTLVGWGVERSEPTILIYTNMVGTAQKAPLPILRFHWTFWHIETNKGLKLIDELRAEIRSEMAAG
jgi:hypothetical protein